MDINTLRGLLTLVLMILFVALVIWVYSGKRKQYFEEQAKVVLDNEPQEGQKP